MYFCLHVLFTGEYAEMQNVADQYILLKPLSFKLSSIQK